MDPGAFLTIGGLACPWRPASTPRRPRRRVDRMDGTDDRHGLLTADRGRAAESVNLSSAGLGEEPGASAAGMLGWHPGRGLNPVKAVTVAASRQAAPAPAARW